MLISSSLYHEVAVWCWDSVVCVKDIKDVSNRFRGWGWSWGQDLTNPFLVNTISIIKQEAQKGSFVISVTMGTLDGGLPHISCVILLPAICTFYVHYMHYYVFLFILHPKKQTGFGGLYYPPCRRNVWAY